jgi:hypothetical protein
MSSFLLGLGSVMFNLSLTNSVRIYRRYITEGRDRMQRVRALIDCNRSPKFNDDSICWSKIYTYIISDASHFRHGGFILIQFLFIFNCFRFSIDKLIFFYISPFYTFIVHHNQNRVHRFYKKSWGPNIFTPASLQICKDPGNEPDYIISLLLKLPSVVEMIWK